MSILRESTYYIHHKGAGVRLGNLLFDFLSSYEDTFRELVFVCIGSDRITGDSLGPLVGHSLSKFSSLLRIYTEPCPARSMP